MEWWNGSEMMVSDGWGGVAVTKPPISRGQVSRDRKREKVGEKDKREVREYTGQKREMES